MTGPPLILETGGPTGHEALPFTLVPSLQNKRRREGFLVRQPMSGPVHGDPMMAVFSRIQRPREVYQLNLPGSREATADFLINTPWS